MAIKRTCDNVQEVCIYLWCLIQSWKGSTKGGFEGQVSMASYGEAARVSERGNVGSTNYVETVDIYWRHLISNPKEWWDNRATRKNLRAPDFKHKTTRKALWIDTR